MDSGLTFDVSRFLEKMKRLDGESRDQIGIETLNDTSARLIRGVRRLTPVGQYEKKSGKKGGTLQRGWRAGTPAKRKDQYRGAVYNPTNYAGYVEDGHRQTPGRFVPAIGKRLVKSWVPGQHMLRDTTGAVEGEFVNILRRHAQRYFREASDK